MCSTSVVQTASFMTHNNLVKCVFVASLVKHHACCFIIRLQSEQNDSLAASLQCFSKYGLRPAMSTAPWTCWKCKLADLLRYQYGLLHKGAWLGSIVLRLKYWDDWDFKQWSLMEIAWHMRQPPPEAVHVLFASGKWLVTKWPTSVVPSACSCVCSASSSCCDAAGSGVSSSLGQTWCWETPATRITCQFCCHKTNRPRQVLTSTLWNEQPVGKTQQPLFSGSSQWLWWWGFTFEKQ